MDGERLTSMDRRAARTCLTAPPLGSAFWLNASSIELVIPVCGVRDLGLEHAGFFGEGAKALQQAGGSVAADARIVFDWG